MNKILSQALKKAVSEYSPNNSELSKSKGPDLFSLSNDTELFQNEKGIIIKIDRTRDSKLTDFGKATLKDRYLGQNESFQDLFARVASSYAAKDQLQTGRRENKGGRAHRVKAFIRVDDKKELINPPRIQEKEFK
jgi:ribonucleotide reductase alpha subunit